MRCDDGRGCPSAGLEFSWPAKLEGFQSPKKQKMSFWIATVWIDGIVNVFVLSNKKDNYFFCANIICISILNCTDDADRFDVILSRVHRDIRMYRTVAEQGPWLFGVKGFVLYMKSTLKLQMTSGRHYGFESRHGSHWIKDCEGNTEASSNRCHKKINLNPFQHGGVCPLRLFVLCLVKKLGIDDNTILFGKYNPGLKFPAYLWTDNDSRRMK